MCFIILLHSFSFICSSIDEFSFSGIFSSGSSMICNLQYFESLFEYSSIASLKNFSLIFPIHNMLIVKMLISPFKL